MVLPVVVGGVDLVDLDEQFGHMLERHVQLDLAIW